MKFTVFFFLLPYQIGTIRDKSRLLEFAEIGAYCQFDLFGTECSFYQLNKEFDMPSDAQRMNHIIRLVHEGYEEKILISQDIHTKHRLVRWFLYSLPRGNVNSQKPRQRYAGCIVHFFLIAMEFVIIVIRQSNIIKKIKRFTKIRTKSQPCFLTAQNTSGWGRILDKTMSNHIALLQDGYSLPQLY